MALYRIGRLPLKGVNVVQFFNVRYLLKGNCLIGAFSSYNFLQSCSLHILLQLLYEKVLASNLVCFVLKD